MQTLFFCALLACTFAFEPVVELTGGIEAPKPWVEVNAPVDLTLSYDLHVALTRSNVTALKNLWDTLTEPSSKRFAQWLSQKELTELIAAPEANIRTVEHWLRTLGIKNFRLDVNRDYIHLTASGDQVQKILGQELRSFQNEKTHQILVRAIGPIRVPKSVAACVDTIVGVGGFPVQHYHHKSTRKPGSPDAIEVTPEVLIQRYNVTTVQKANAKNRKAVAEFQGQYISQTDVCKFFSDYSLNGTCTISHYYGSKNIQNDPGVESTLDVDYIDGLADETPLDYYLASGMDFCSDLLTWTSDISNAALPGWVHSVSYGEQRHKRVCAEADMNRLDQDFMKLNTRGISFIIASGDSGSGWWARDGWNDDYLCPSWPSSSEYCTAVGSTYFYEGNRDVEQATTQFGSGGGFSFWHTRPSFQDAAVTEYLKKAKHAKGKWNQNGRATPDVSAMGEEFTIVIRGGKEPGIGGTSASTPTFAGIITRLNDKRLNAGKTTLGGALNKLIYSNPQMFYDVTIGSDRIGLNREHGWDTAVGWDPVTGMGTPNYAAMEKVVMSLP
eukprot:TRINITY_DN66548_c2_g2_i1.p1 TRINITY_DN66548_c2_g2~~TRINITY_DN66548_c2_g2_i1.p1  ORF type:complete len:563 (-),score=104.13 TRINITY_DN66548_c2_g2_i1:836-2500(-)